MPWKANQTGPPKLLSRTTETSFRPADIAHQAARGRADQERGDVARSGVVLERFCGVMSPACGSMALRGAGSQAMSSDRDDLDEVIEADEVCRVAGVEARFVSVRRCSNQQVEDT